MPESLLDEVTSLVEWPVVYPCRFEDEFLQVPQECLILTMQTNQKYFALTDVAGKLRSRFLIVSNIETKTPGEIIEGNERVVRPRLADAKFFFEQDKKSRSPSACRSSRTSCITTSSVRRSHASSASRRWPARSPPRSVPTPRTRSAPRVSRRPTC